RRFRPLPPLISPGRSSGPSRPPARAKARHIFARAWTIPPPAFENLDRFFVLLGRLHSGFVSLHPASDQLNRVIPRQRGPLNQGLPWQPDQSASFVLDLLKRRLPRPLPLTRRPTPR